MFRKVSLDYGESIEMTTFISMMVKVGSRYQESWYKSRLVLRFGESIEVMRSTATRETMLGRKFLGH